MKKQVLKGIVSPHVTVNAFFKEDADGKVTADCPEIPGCVVTGRNENDAKQKIKSAVEACLKKLLSEARKKLREKRSRTAGRG